MKCICYLEPISKGIDAREQGSPGWRADGQRVEVVQDDSPTCQSVQHVCDGTRVVPRHIVHSLQQQGGN